MRFYHVEKTPEGVTVDVIDSQHPKGGYALDSLFGEFDFGHSSRKTANLAYALIADAFQDEHIAAANHYAFKNKVLAPMEGDRFEISQEDVRQAVKEIKRVGRAN
jgi:hypothetical protein